MPIIQGTWGTVADAVELTGHTPDDATLVMAQAIIQNRIRRVWRATDAARSEYTWLRQAVAHQAGYMADPANAALFEQAEISSTSQDGWSVTFRDGQVPRRYAPEAIAALECLPGAANVTVRINSGFQPRGRRGRRTRWQAY